MTDEEEIQCYRSKSNINYYFDKDNYKSLRNKISTITDYIHELDRLLNYNYKNCKHTEKYKNAKKYRDMIYGSDDTIRKLWRGIWNKLNHRSFKIKPEPKQKPKKKTTKQMKDLPKPISHEEKIKDMEYKLLRGDLSQRNKIRDFKKKIGVCHINIEEYIPIQNKFTETLMTVQKRGVGKLPERINEITNNTLKGVMDKTPTHSTKVINNEWFLSYQSFKVCPEIVEEYIKAIEFVLDGKNKFSATLQKRLDLSVLRQLMIQFKNISKPKPQPESISNQIKKDIEQLLIKNGIEKKINKSSKPTPEKKRETVEEYHNRRWKRVLDLEPDKDGYIDYEYVKYADKKKEFIEWMEQYYKITKNEAEKIWKKFIKYCNDTQACSKPDVNYYSLYDAQRNIFKQGIYTQIAIFARKYMKDKSKSKSEDNSFMKPIIKGTINKYVSEAIDDYEKSKKKTKKVVIKKERKKAKPLPKTTKKEKVIVDNGNIIWNEYLKLMGKEMSKNGWFKTRDSSATIKKKLVLRIVSMKGLMKRHQDRRFSKDHKVNIESSNIYEYAENELKRLEDLYKRGSTVGYKAVGSNPSRSTKKDDDDDNGDIKQPKKSTQPKQPKLIQLINTNYKGKLDLTKDKIIDKKVIGDDIMMRIKDVKADDTPIVIIRITPDYKSNMGLSVKLFKPKLIESSNKTVPVLHSKYFIYTDLENLKFT
jgi:hypothetical protein